MRVFIAGATGTLGLPLVRRLVAAGHSVVGTTRSAARALLLEAAGARAAVVDALDAAALTRAVQGASPEVVVNLLTALPPVPLRPRDLRPTNRLRTEGAANLLRAATEAGARRLIAESFVSVVGRTDSTRPLREDDPLGTIPPGDPARETVEALRSLEARLAEARRSAAIETVALRYAFFYGPRVPSTEAILATLRARRFFLPAGLEAISSWIHIEDAAAATHAAVEHPRPAALYHIADDEPLPLAEAARCFAEAFALPGPRSMPAWVVRLAAPLAASMAAMKLWLDNSQAKTQFGWRPDYPTLRAGLADLARRTPAAA